MKFFMVALLAYFGASCSRNSENIIQLPDGHIQPTTPERIVIRSSDGSASAQRRTGPAPLLLGPEALQVVYKDVFADSMAEIQPDFFDQTQKDELGGYRILKPSNPRGGFTAADPVMKRNTKLTSDYIFTLRKFASTACQALVDKEIVNQSNPSNLLVEGSNPTIGKIDNFLSLMLGYKSRTGIHRGIQTYKDAFAKMMSSAPVPQSDEEKSARLKASYNHLCVALATDVRVYVR